MERTPVETVAKYVHGLTWPANKGEVLDVLQRNGAPEDVLQIVRSSNRERFASPNDVHAALWSRP